MCRGVDPPPSPQPAGSSTSSAVMLLPETRIAQYSRPCEEISYYGSCTNGRFRWVVIFTARRAPNEPNLSSMSDAGQGSSEDCEDLQTRRLQLEAATGVVLAWPPAAWLQCRRWRLQRFDSMCCARRSSAACAARRELSGQQLRGRATGAELGSIARGLDQIQQSELLLFVRPAAVRGRLTFRLRMVVRGLGRRIL